jgi:hypothetical protein
MFAESLPSNELFQLSDVMSHYFQKHSFTFFIMLGLLVLGLTVQRGEINHARRSEARARESRSGDQDVFAATRFSKMFCS